MCSRNRSRSAGSSLAPPWRNLDRGGDHRQRVPQVVGGVGEELRVRAIARRAGAEVDERADHRPQPAVHENRRRAREELAEPAVGPLHGDAHVEDGQPRPHGTVDGPVERFEWAPVHRAELRAIVVAEAEHGEQRTIRHDDLVAPGFLHENAERHRVDRVPERRVLPLQRIPRLADGRSANPHELLQDLVRAVRPLRRVERMCDPEQPRDAAGVVLVGEALDRDRYDPLGAVAEADEEERMPLVGRDPCHRSPEEAAVGPVDERRERLAAQHRGGGAEQLCGRGVDLLDAAVRAREQARIAHGVEERPVRRVVRRHGRVRPRPGIAEWGVVVRRLTTMLFLSNAVRRRTTRAPSAPSARSSPARSRPARGGASSGPGIRSPSPAASGPGARAAGARRHRRRPPG